MTRTTIPSPSEPSAAAIPGTRDVRAPQQDWLDLGARNLTEAVRLQADWTPGADCMMADGWLGALAPVDCPAAPFNVVMRTSEGVDGDRLLENAHALFLPKRRAFSVYVRKHADADLEHECRSRGFIRCADMPVMILSLSAFEGESRPRDCEVDLEPVKTIDGVFAFAEVAAAAYEGAQVPKEAVISGFARPDRVLASSTELFLVRHRGQRVGCGMLLWSGVMAGIYWVGTVPWMRRRGFGQASAQLLTMQAFQNGAGCVCLQASPSSESMYGRIGYVEISRLSCYCWPFATRSSLKRRAQVSSHRDVY